MKYPLIIGYIKYHTEKPGEIEGTNTTNMVKRLSSSRLYKLSPVSQATVSAIWNQVFNF